MVKKDYIVIGPSGQLGASLLNTYTGGIGLSLRNGNLSSLKVLEAEFGDFRSVVINTAAATKVDALEEKASLATGLNIEFPLTLAEYCVDQKNFLIHISTDYVFDGFKKVPLKYVESDSPNPLSVYGKSKLAGERAVEEVMADNYAIFRTSWLYSAVQGRPNFVKTMLRLALADSQKKISVVNDQYGTPTSTAYLASQIIDAIDNPIEGLFHASSEGYCTWYEFAVMFLEMMAVPHNIVPCTTAEYPTKAPRPKNSVLENARLKELGRNLAIDWRDDLEKFVALNKDKLIAEVSESLD